MLPQIRAPAHSDSAGRILRSLLQSVAEPASKLSPPILEALLLASLRRPMEETTRFVVEHLNNLQLGRILPQMGERAFVLTTKIISDSSLGLEKKLEWIDGLRRAGGVRPLLHLLSRRQNDKAISDASAVAVLRLSKSLAFKQEVETWSSVRDLENSAYQTLTQKWGWPFKHPTTDMGRRLMSYLAERLAEQPARATWERAIASEVDPRLLYLSSAIRKERKIPQLELDYKFLRRFQRSSTFVLRSIWSSVAVTRRTAWIRWAGKDNSGLEVPGGLAVLLLYLWCFLALTLPLLQLPTLGLIWPYGLCLLGVGLILGIAIFGERREGEDFIMGSFMGPVIFFQWLGDKRPLLRWLGYTSALLFIFVLSAVISQSTPIRIIFGFILVAQIPIARYGAFDSATHPIFANETTLALTNDLIEADYGTDQPITRTSADE